MKGLEGFLQPLSRDDYRWRKINEAEERSRITKQAFVRVMKAGNGRVGQGGKLAKEITSTLENSQRNA